MKAMKSSIRISKGGNRIHATGDAANELFKAISGFDGEEGETIVTPTPERCRKWGCNAALLEQDSNGFVICPSCGASYGKG